MVVGAVIAAIVGAVVGVVVAGLRERRAGDERLEAARVQAQSLIQRGRREAQSQKTKEETAARTAALAERARLEDELAARESALSSKEASLAAIEDELEETCAQVELRDAELNERHQRIQSKRDRQAGLRKDVEARVEEARARIEERAGVAGAEVADRLGRRWIEEAQADAAHRLRAIDQTTSDPVWGREATRILEIASARYRNHFLTERLVSNVKVAEGVAEALVADDQRILLALQEVANVTLNVSEAGDAVRLEGLDGVGREIARRALAKLSKKPEVAGQAGQDPTVWAGKIREQLEREIVGLGRKAFQVLGIPKAHPEIVDLVGRLNWRTSYTQNQWRHAVEASFLAGMMASEMNLDLKLARRATLLHDIGKALTHEIEGSHAVIGADIARRLGEDEVVANAIGAHHLDEPMNSVYAHLVAAADAMSGARPGARREHEGGYNTRLQDLERIGRAYAGVDRCYAVHGGRELRVYVDDSRVSDLDAVELSQEIAAQVSEEMVFPGQIKVTVIRATEAVSTAN